MVKTLCRHINISKGQQHLGTLWTQEKWFINHQPNLTTTPNNGTFKWSNPKISTTAHPNITTLAKNT